jgi:ubiquinone biosynthesis protein COQ9
MSIDEIRVRILNDAKSIIEKKGWNKDLFLNISKSTSHNIDELRSLFPKGYRDLLEIYLNQINDMMTIESKKINLIRLRTHERIRELIILRLNIMLKNKRLISKTFLYLFIPKNYKFSLKHLYCSVDQIWFLAGDNSYDFNFYSKRAILASVYTATMIHFTNNSNIDETIDILDKNLKKVSNIPKIKNRLNDFVKIVPQIIKMRNKFSFFKQ